MQVLLAEWGAKSPQAIQSWLYRPTYSVGVAGAGAFPLSAAVLAAGTGTDPWTRMGRLSPREVRRPVLSLTAVEALCFAKLLGGERGRLPSGREWDRAAGRFDGALGPCKPGWPGPGRREEPTPVGAEAADESVFGCRGMAANGRELTSDVSLQPQLVFPDIVRPGGDDKLVLRGGSFDDDEPFKFKALEDSLIPPDALEYWLPYRDVSFRVVIEPPVGP